MLRQAREETMVCSDQPSNFQSTAANASSLPHIQAASRLRPLLQWNCDNIVRPMFRAISFRILTNRKSDKKSDSTNIKHIDLVIDESAPRVAIMGALGRSGASDGRVL
jgi:hypothetical protein